MVRKFVTWTVGTEVGHSEGFDWEQPPESVLAELTRYLTDPRVLRDNAFFSCGVWALPEEADNLTEVDADDPARANSPPLSPWGRSPTAWWMRASTSPC